MDKLKPLKTNKKILNSLSSNIIKKEVKMKKRAKMDKELDKLFKKLQATESKTFRGWTTRQILEWARNHG